SRSLCTWGRLHSLRARAALFELRDRRDMAPRPSCELPALRHLDSAVNTQASLSRTHLPSRLHSSSETTSSSSATIFSKPDLRLPTPPSKIATDMPVPLCGTSRASPRTAYYRCKFPAEYAIAEEQHPKTLYVREQAIVPSLDEWIGSLFADEHL